jgi:multidrug efflux pump subunit AcrA (membrane-fusion protein)
VTSATSSDAAGDPRHGDPQPGGKPHAAEPQVVVHDQLLWRELTAATTDAAFGQAWLGLACRMIADAHTGALLLLPGGTADPVLCGWPASSPPDPGLLAAAHASMQAGRGTLQPGTQAVTRLAYPVLLDGTVVAAAAFDIAADPPNASHANARQANPPNARQENAADARRANAPDPRQANASDARRAMRQLQWAAAWLRDWRRRRDAAAFQGITERTTLALDLLAAALEEPHFAAACRVSVTELATRFGCERVSIGFSRRLRSSVVAISHTAQFGKSMSLVRMLAEAMDEAIDQHSPVLHPPPETEDWMVTRAHAALAAAHGSGAVLTIPLFVRDHFAGAVVFERAAEKPFDQTTIDLAEAVVAILGPALIDKREAERGLPSLIAGRIAAQAIHLFGPGYWGRKLSLAAIAAAIIFCVSARGPYRIAADARVEGAVQRAMVAPFDGFIAAASVKAGDTVRTGQTLASLDDRDLVLERLRWVTERQQHMAEYDQALSHGNRADAGRFHALADEASAQMRLIDEQLRRTQIDAPFDGLVVSGDLSQSIGAPARRGDVLFEIAPLDDWRVVLRVPESQIAAISPGQRGKLLVAALPDVALPFTVLRIVPVAEAHDGKMLFRVDAQLLATTPRLRPGMEGLGEVDAGRARLVWIWFRSLLHWVRIESWAWLP